MIKIISMEKEYHVYIGWAVFALSMFGVIPLGGLIGFPSMVYAVFRADELKKDDEAKGDRLVWLSIAVFIAVTVVPFVIGFYA